MHARLLPFETEQLKHHFLSVTWRKRTQFIVLITTAFGNFSLASATKNEELGLKLFKSSFRERKFEATKIILSFIPFFSTSTSYCLTIKKKNDSVLNLKTYVKIYPCNINQFYSQYTEETAFPMYLYDWRLHRHHNCSSNVEFQRLVCQSLGMVASRCRDHTLSLLLLCQVEQRIECSAIFKTAIYCMLIQRQQMVLNVFTIQHCTKSKGRVEILFAVIH